MKFSPSLPLAALPLALCSVFPALAQIQLKETVVTATRSARTADELMQSIEVLTRQEIESSGATTVMDLLAGLPGVSVARAGGVGKTTSVFLRGANAGHVLVLVNGVRAGSATLGEFDWNAYLPEQIERIELVRGPAASLYGSDAIAGVIQIFTRPGTKGVSVSQGIGSHQTRETSIRFAGGDGVKWGLSASNFETDGIQAKVVDPKRYGYNNSNLSLGVAVPLAADWQLDAGLTRSQGHNPGNVSAGSSDFVNQVLDIGLSGTVHAGWKQRLTANAADDELTTPNGFPPSKITTRRHQLSWLNELDLESGALTLGVDRLVEDVGNHDPLTGAAAFDHSLSSTGLFAQYFTSIAGYDFQLGARHDKHNVYGTVNTHNVSVGKNVLDGVRVYVAHGTAFKGPTVNDLYWPYTSFTDTTGDCVTYGYACTFITQGNPVLRPERSRSNEIGVKIDGPVNYQFTLFDTHVNDLISWDFTTTGSGASLTETWYPNNIGSASMRGLEASASLRAVGWHWRLSGTRLLAVDESTGAPLDRRPANSASLRVGRRWGAHDISASWLATSSRYESQGTRRIPGFARVDVVDTIRLSQPWSLRVAVENLFDRTYALSTTSGIAYATPGRTVKATLRYTF